MKSSVLVLACLLILTLGFNSKAHEHHDLVNVAQSSPGLVSDTSKIESGGYRYMPHMLVLPSEVDIKHAHGLARDNEDNIYLAYESNAINENTRAIAQFNKQGKFVRYIGDANLAWGAPHGLDLVYENGEKFLYLSNNWSAVRKINMQGQVVWEASDKPDSSVYQDAKYLPTDTAALPLSSTLLVADGYGASQVMDMNNSNGKFGQLTLTGEQTGSRFNTPHGVTYDPRTAEILVSDREKFRLVYFDTKGTLTRILSQQGVSQVCNTDVLEDRLLVTNLDGTVAYLNKQNKLIDTIELNKVLGSQGHKHPHDAIFMSNGDIVIGTWNPGRLSYWKKI